MPLHDWNDESGWMMVHHLWISELARWLKVRLPAGYRAFIGSSPVLTVDIPGKPDVGVRDGVHQTNGHPFNSSSEMGVGSESQLDYGDVRVATVVLAPGKYVYVEHDGRLVAAIELISPANKDRPSAREAATNRYAGYIQNGVHLLLVDLLPKPRGFSFAESIGQDLHILDQSDFPAPLAVSYRVGERSTVGESIMELRQRPLQAGQPLPVLPLAISNRIDVPIDLETTYMKAAADAYLA